MFERILRMIIKEFIHVLRDNRMKAVLFVAPVLQLILFGYAVTWDISNIRTALVDLDKSPISRELIRQFESSGYFRIVKKTNSPRDIATLLDEGKINIALEIPSGFSTDIKAKRQAIIQVILDGTDSNTATVAMDYTNRIVGRFSENFMINQLTGDNSIGIHLSRIDLQSRAWYNPDLKSNYYNVPGVIAFIIMLTSLLLTSMAIVREREIGTMEQLMVTPITPLELILGKTIPFAIISFIDVLLITAVGVFWFEIPIRGNLILLLFCTTLYLLSTLGIGLFISTVSHTQQQAMMSTFFFFLPAILLSGFMFPISNMPLLIQYITYLNPLRYFLVIVRGIFLKGIGANILWPQMLALFILGMLVIIMSSLRFRKKLA